MKTVLVVEDEPPIANYIAEVLCSYDYNALALYDPADALEHVKAIRFDAALLGINMPNMGGIELGVRIRNVLPDCGIIVGIEDLLDDSEQNTLRSTHGFDYLPEPFGLEDLLTKVFCLLAAIEG